MTPRPTRRQALLTGAAVAALGSSSLAADDAKRRILIVVGPSSHPPGTHEVAAGGRLLKYALEKSENLSGISADLVTEWPEAKALADVKCVAFIGDMFPPAVMKDGEQAMKDLTAMTAKGCGIVCLHYATGLEAKHVTADGDHPLLHWMGGYFATRCNHHKSVARVFEAATVEPGKADHPVLRGWKKFTVNDEPYINNFFGKDGPAKNVTILATSQLPPEKPQPETVAWAIDRKDGGRGVGVVMPHFFRNWKHDDLRTLILNAVVWATGIEVPKTGVQVKLPELSEFKPDAVEPKKK